MEYTKAEREQMEYDQPMGEFLHSNSTPAATLRRVEDDVTVIKIPIARGYMSIEQITDGRVDTILIHDNEISDLIRVLCDYKNQLYSHTED